MSVLPGVEWRGVRATSPLLFAWYFALAALALKLLALRRMTELSAGKTVAAAITISSVSTFLVTVAPVGLILWVWLHDFAARRFTSPEFSDPAIWVPMLMTIALVACASDALVLRVAFGQRIGRREFGILIAANAVWIALMASALLAYAYTHPPEARLLRDSVQREHQRPQATSFFVTPPGVTGGTHSLLKPSPVGAAGARLLDAGDSFDSTPAESPKCGGGFVAVGRGPRAR